MQLKSISIAVMCSSWMLLAGCGSDDTDGRQANGTAGSNGTAGTSGGTGSAAGTGGGEAGTNGGVGGGGAGTGGDDAPEGCAVATDGTPAELHDAAAAVLTSPSTCGFSSCHIDRGKAGLVLVGATDMNALMVDVPSCLVPQIPLVKSGGGDEALEGSWLWLKLVAPADAAGVVTSNPDWGTAGTTCDASPSQPFGLRMPWGTPGSSYAAETTLTAVRNWICAGAPAPM